MGFLKLRTTGCVPAWTRPVGLFCISGGILLQRFLPASGRFAVSPELRDFCHGLLLGVGIGLLLGSLIMDRRAKLS